MVVFGIEPGASSHPASVPAAERPYVIRRRRELGDANEAFSLAARLILLLGGGLVALGLAVQGLGALKNRRKPPFAEEADPTSTQSTPMWFWVMGGISFAILAWIAF